MTTQQKVDGLNNLETLSSSANAYTDSILHGERYYTKAENAARYFTSATDGTGSGLIAATLGGWTAQQIIDSGTPSGCIGMWSSTEGTIPAGWHLCDGTNSTPNLQDRFIVGAGGNYTCNSQGGADLVTTTGSVTISGHPLTAAETPLHTHGTITDYYPITPITGTVWGEGQLLASTQSTPGSLTDYAGSGTSHGHTATFAGTSNQDHRPPFYALCYIKKS
jgi:hypothetical protein